MTAHNKDLTSTRTQAAPAAKVVAIGNSHGIVLGKEILAKLNVGRGDLVYLVESPDGVLLTPYDPKVAEQVESGKRFMRKYRDTFRALAK
jgi:putative addiction module antidote